MNYNWRQVLDLVGMTVRLNLHSCRNLYAVWRLFCLNWILVHSDHMSTKLKNRMKKMIFNFWGMLNCYTLLCACIIWNIYMYYYITLISVERISHHKFDCREQEMVVQHGKIYFDLLIKLVWALCILLELSFTLHVFTSSILPADFSRCRKQMVRHGSLEVIIRCDGQLGEKRDLHVRFFHEIFETAADFPILMPQIILDWYALNFLLVSLRNFTMVSL